MVPKHTLNKVMIPTANILHFCAPMSLWFKCTAKSKQRLSTLLLTLSKIILSGVTVLALNLYTLHNMLLNRLHISANENYHFFLKNVMINHFNMEFVRHTSMWQSTVTLKSTGWKRRPGQVIQTDVPSEGRYRPNPSALSSPRQIS